MICDDQENKCKRNILLIEIKYDNRPVARYQGMMQRLYRAVIDFRIAIQFFSNNEIMTMQIFYCLDCIKLVSLQTPIGQLCHIVYGPLNVLQYNIIIKSDKLMFGPGDKISNTYNILVTLSPFHSVLLCTYLAVKKLFMQIYKYKYFFVPVFFQAMLKNPLNLQKFFFY